MPARRRGSRGTSAAISVPGEHHAGDPACPARYAARLTSQGSQKLAQRDVVRIAENQPVDEDPGMSLEHAHDQVTSPPVKIVQAHDELRLPRRELIYFCFVGEPRLHGSGGRVPGNEIRIAY